MMKTVKAYSIKEVSGRELFKTNVATRDLYSSSQLENVKSKITKDAHKIGDSVEFLEDDGIIFYTYNSSKDDFTVIDHLRRMPKFINENKDARWCFGFVNRLNGKISLLFGGHTVADEASAHDLFTIARELVRKRFPSLSSHLITFSIKK